MAETLRPKWLLKSLSSAEMIALRRCGEISSYEMTSRRSVANSPSVSPFDAYTRVMALGA